MAKHRKPTTTKLRTLAVLGAILLAIVFVGVYHVRNTSAFVDATTHQPERYTELYFSDPTTIPVNVIHDKQLPISFTAHNAEAQSMTYSYSVEFIGTNGKILTQKQGSFTLKSNAAESITNDLTVPNTYRGKAEVQVVLTNLQQQSIHFWVEAR
jgi:hypothetical protein